MGLKTFGDYPLRFDDLKYIYGGQHAKGLQASQEQRFLMANPWAAIMPGGEIFTPQQMDAPIADILRDRVYSLVPGTDPGEDVKEWEDVVRWAAKQRSQGNYPDIARDEPYGPVSPTDAREWDFWQQMYAAADPQFETNYPEYQTLGQRGRLEDLAEEQETTGEQTQTDYSPPPTPEGQRPTAASIFAQLIQKSPYQRYRDKRERVSRRSQRRPFYLGGNNTRIPTLLGG